MQSLTYVPWIFTRQTNLECSYVFRELFLFYAYAFATSSGLINAFVITNPIT